MREAIAGYISEIEKAVTHMRQTTLNSKANQTAQSILSSGRMALRGRKNPHDYTDFPVDNLPKILTPNFFGREAQIDKIHKHLGANDQQLRVYTTYGTRGIGKTQIALEYARRYKDRFNAVFWVSSYMTVSIVFAGKLTGSVYRSDQKPQPPCDRALEKLR
jgi:hypothetical protein